MIKKITNVLLVLFLLFVAPVTTFAAETDPQLTIQKEGSTFSVYKVLDATKSGKAYVYQVNDNYTDFFGNETYGKYTFNKTKGIIKADGTLLAPVDSSNTTIESPSGVKPSADMELLTGYLQKYIKDKSLTGQSIMSGTPTSLEAGYYLVTEINSHTNNYVVASKAMMVNLTNDMTIYPKDDATILDKKIIEDNQLKDTSDAKIGDQIKYQITSVIPTYDSTVKSITYKFTDTLSKGLTYDDNLTIKFSDSTNVDTTKYTINQSTDQNGITTLTIEIDGNYAIENSGKTLVLSYSATLNENALVSDTTGNSNQVKLEYSKGNSQTIDVITDETKTYSYNIGINKKDNEDYSILENAKFGIYKDDIQIGQLTTTTHGNDQFTDMDGKALGLSSGQYVIKELEAPNGYSMLGTDIYITLTPEIIDGHLTGKATLSAKDKDGNQISEVSIASGEEASIDLQLDVINYKGISLPGTGGQGTQILMIVGGTFIVIAVGAYVFMEKKRKK